MRSYGRVETAFWQNHKIARLDDSTKLLLLYLYSCPHGNAAGCFLLPLGYMMADLGWDQNRVSERVSDLVQRGFIEHDAETGLIRIVGWFGHNGIENSNVAKGIAAILRRLPAGPIFDNLVNDLVRLGNRFMSPLLPEFATGSETRSNRVPKRGSKPGRTAFEPPEPDPVPIGEEGTGFLESPKNVRVVDSAEALPAPLPPPALPPEPPPPPPPAPRQAPLAMPQAVPVPPPGGLLVDMPEGGEEGAATRKARQLTKLAEEAVGIWNTRCAFALGEVQRMTDQRKRRLLACLGVLDYSLERWRDTCVRIVNSANLRGEKNNTGWKANFDYVIRDDVFTRILEGAYDDAPTKKAPPKRPTV